MPLWRGHPLGASVQAVSGQCPWSFPPCLSSGRSVTLTLHLWAGAFWPSAENAILLPTPELTLPSHPRAWPPNVSQWQVPPTPRRPVPTLS